VAGAVILRDDPERFDGVKRSEATPAPAPEASDGLQDYAIKRDGLRDLTFRGELLAEGSSHSHQGDRQNRWNEIHVYRTKGGKLVLHREYFTCWQGEHGASTADAYATPKELFDGLTRGEDGAFHLSTMAYNVLIEAGFGDLTEESVE
jgi:hypothetical protein